jgi:hypothetical protein
MGRPLKIAKNSPMSGIFYDPSNQGTTAQSVLVDIGYPPFAAPTSMDTATVVLPSPATTIPFTGVVGGAPVISAPSPSFPVVSCQVNIALPSGTGAGVATGRIIRQKGAHKFLVVDTTTVNDEDMVANASYMILSLGGTDWQQMGAPDGAIAGTIFTCTATVASASTGTALLVGNCILTDSNTPTVGNMSIAMAVGGDSTEVYISKLTNRFAQDFNGGAAGGNADTGDVWNPGQVINDIEYVANFFTDVSTFAKSGAETATWAGTAQNSDGTLGLAQVEKITS